MANAGKQPQSIDDVVDEMPQQNPAIRPEQPGSMTYDDAMKYVNAQNNAQNAGGLEKKVEEKPKDDGWNFKQIAKDVLKFSPFAAINWLASGGYAYLMGTGTFLASASTFLSPLGYVGARWLLNRKEKKKTTWYDIRKELGVGNFVGVLGYWLYQVPEYLIAKTGLNTSTIGGKILKTMAFNPLMYFPFIPIYQTMVYIRDKIGIKKAAKGLYNGKAPGYIKEAYQNKVKPEFWQGMKSSPVLFPSHLATIGFGLVTMPSLRVGIGAIHDLVFGLFAGSKKKEGSASEHKERLPVGQRIKSFYKSIPSKVDNFFKVPGYEPLYQPAGAIAGGYSH